VSQCGNQLDGRFGQYLPARSNERHGALTGDCERPKERQQIETVGGVQSHRTSRGAGADGNLTCARRRANGCCGQNRLHLRLGAGDVAAAIVDHHITAGLLDSEQHRVPLPKRRPKLDDTEHCKKEHGGYQRRFDRRRSLVPAKLWILPTHKHYCVRTTLVAVTADGKPGQENMGLKLRVAVTDTN